MKKIYIFIIFFLGLGVLLIIDLGEGKRRSEEREQRLQHIAELCQIHVKDTLAEQIKILQSVASIIAYTPSFTEKCFATFSENFKELHKELEDLSFTVSDDRKGQQLSQGKAQISISREVDENARLSIHFPVTIEGKSIGVLAADYELSSLLARPLSISGIDNELEYALRDSVGNYLLGSPIEGKGKKTVEFRVADQEWQVILAWEKTAQHPVSNQRIVFWLMGTAIFLCSLYLYSLSQKLETTVRLRTQELTVVNQKLKDEISVHRETSEALVAGEERYRALFDHNPIQTIVVDEKARIVMFNFARRKNEGRLPVIGAVMYRDYASLHEVDMYAELFHCIQSGKLKEFQELRYKERYLRVNISPFSGGAIITSIDITSTKVMADRLQQKHKMEAIGTLAGGIAHDFNNILGIIIGNAELAADDIPVDNPAIESLSEIEIACTRARDVVKQLLSFSRRTQPINEPLNISLITEETVKLLRASISKSIDIHSFIPDNLQTIKGNISQIQQVLINLCTNAAHAMEENGGTLTVNLRNRTLDSELYEGYQTITSGEYVELEVTDTGHGIGSDIRGKIFDPYFTTREIGKGSGMGLSVVLGILKSHGAYIWVDSLVKQGTVVKVLFPVVYDDPQEIIEKNIVIKGGTERILFIDDELSLLRTGKMYLERFGYTVDTHVNPLEALNHFVKYPGRYDLIISDMSMPGKSGDKLVGEIRSVSQDVPIILCSGYSDSYLEKDILALGAQKFLEKPYEIKNLVNVVREILDARRLGSW